MNALKQITEKNLNILEGLEMLRLAKKQIAEKEAKLKKQILSVMAKEGTNELIVGNKKAVLIESERVSLDTKAIKDLIPNWKEDYSITSNVQTLKVL